MLQAFRGDSIAQLAFLPGPTRLLLVAACCLLGPFSGCDRTAPQPVSEAARGHTNPKFVATSISPRSTIDQTVRSYQQLRSYEDEAYVKLVYELDGQPLEDRAPLSIGWDASGRVGLKAYSVEAGPSQTRWRLRLRDDNALVPGQVLSRTLPSKVDFAWLLSDPLVAEHLSAGLAGFPPQLDLLLSEHPLQGLIDESAALSFSHPETVDGRACVVVKVQRGPAEFVLWIDQASLLLRRLKLPQSHLTPQMLADQRISHVELTIEFANARGNQDVDWARFTIQPQTDELRVSRFVPRPLAIDTSGLGEQRPAFHLEDADGKTVYDSSENERAQRKATVLMWLADHPTCRLASEQLQRIAQALEDHGLPAGSVELVSVWAEPLPAAGTTFESLPRIWNLPGKLALDREALGRDLFQVSEAPTLIVLDQQNRLQLRESRSNPLLDQVLPELLERLARGEDLADEIISRQEVALARFDAELQLAAAVDAQLSSGVQNHSPYPAETFELRELRRNATRSAAVAVAIDDQQSLWTLYADGELQRRSSLGQTNGSNSDPQSYPTRWSIDPALNGRIEVAPSCETIAYSTPGGNVVELFQCDNSQQRTVRLEASAKVVDFRWLSLSGQVAARLAVITQNGKTVLIDPRNSEQLSGRCASEPRALLLRRNPKQAIDGQVAMADRTIEPLLLAPDSTHAAQLGLGRQIAVVRAAADAGANASSPTRLAFQPDAGPWLTWQDETQELTLARGWIATDEPAVFMLDQNLNQRWHYRLPLQSRPLATAVAVAKDPTSGQPVWCLLAAHNTIHLLRGDGLIIDHFRPLETVVGLALLPNGDRLELQLVYAKEAVRYQIDWK